MFLFYVSLHCLLSFVICLLYALLFSRKEVPELLNQLRQPGQDPETLKELKKELILQIISAFLCLYTLLLTCFLGSFAASMHSHAMKGTTTNESLRKRWNASRSADQQIQVDTNVKMRHFYWDPLPDSRI